MLGRGVGFRNALNDGLVPLLRSQIGKRPLLLLERIIFCEVRGLLLVVVDDGLSQKGDVDDVRGKSRKVVRRVLRSSRLHVLSPDKPTAAQWRTTENIWLRPS